MVGLSAPISHANRLCVDEKVFSEGAYADSHEKGAVKFDEENRDLVRGRASLSRMPEMPLRGRRKPVFGDSAMARMPEVRTYVVESHALRRGGSLQVTPRGPAVTCACGQVGELQEIVVGVLKSRREHLLPPSEKAG